MKIKYCSIVFVCLCLMSACSSGSAPAPATPTKQTPSQLTVYWWPGDFQGDLTPLIDLYRGSFPSVTVQVDNSGWDGEAYVSQLQTALQSGQGPDIILFNTRATMPNIAKLVDAGVFEDLNPYMESDPSYDPSKFVQPVIGAGNVGGQQLFMPYQYAIPMYAADQTTLEQAGLGGLPDLDQDEMIDTVADYSSRTGQIVFPADDIGVFPFNDTVYQLLASSGLQVYDLTEKKLTISHEDLIHLLTNYQKYHSASEPDGYYDMLGKDPDTYPYQLESGFINKDFLLYDYTEQYGANTSPLEFQLFTSQVGSMSVEYFPYPGLEKGSGLTAVPTGFVGLNANSTNKHAAYYFMRTIMSYPFNNDPWYFPIDRTLQQGIDSLLSGAQIQHDSYYDVKLTPGQFSASNLSDYLTNVNNVTSGVAYDRNIMQIMCTAFEDFAAGKIADADTAASQIEQQVSFYLSE